MTVITNMPMYQVLSLISALKFYRDTGMKVNRAYTPTNMLALAGQITGYKFTRGKFNHAIGALEDWLAARQAEGETLQTDREFVLLERNCK